MWVFNVGSEKSPMMNQIRLYKDIANNKYYLLDKFEDGSKSLKEVSIKKEGVKFIIEFVPSAKDSYYISESDSLIYLKTEGYDNDLKALEGEFNSKAI